MGAREERVARNESLFREVNERIKQVNVGLATIEAIDFLCECGDKSCAAPISLTMSEYEEVRAAPTHFAVVPGHVVAIEHVISSTDRYAVVAKTDPTAVNVVVAEDPRS